MCFLYPILTGIVCALLGYLIGRLFSTSKISFWETKYFDIEKKYESTKVALDESVNSWKDKYQNIQNQLAETKEKIATLVPREEKELWKERYAELKVKIEAQPKVTFDAKSVKEAYGKRIKLDDLKIVEGIGPKIEQLFHNFNIKTWKSLSECSIEKCQEVLNSGGERYRLHKPGTWPKQASYAVEGKWEELKEWQDNLKGGKE